ncbi:DUF2514 family protein [Alcaligenes faecalis]|uniref:DUF2514 family protein n=1 Tax=Alcaligenes faecalis TaxID=511 RepID=UPI00208E1386|nr:DUF2514 family protein [Alcaligenes faecalis]USP46961.1 DUF2514 family protein [Alcaligenes faecalis]
MSIRSAVVGAAVLAALFLGLKMYGSAQHRKGYDKAQAEYMVAVAHAEGRARQIEQQKQKEVEDVRADYQKQLDAASGAAISARADSDGLRGKLKAANDRAVTEAARAGRALDENTRITAELRNVVGLCTARYTEMAGVADSYRGDLMALQGYALTVQGRN